MKDATNVAIITNYEFLFMWVRCQGIKVRAIGLLEVYVDREKLLAKCKKA